MSREAMAPFEAILAALNLPPDRSLRLKELIVERGESGGDALELSKDGKIGPEDAAKVRDEAESFFEQKIEEVAGAANVKRIEQMLSLTPQLEQVVQTVGQDLEGSEVPLTTDQTLQLAQIYKDTYAAPQTGSGFPPDRTAGFDPQTGLGMPTGRLWRAPPRC